MDIIYYLFAVAIFSIAALAAIAIWAPRKTWVRVSAVCITVLFVPLIYIELMGLLSKPKPMAYEWWESQVKKAEVLGVSLHEGEAIYMWLRLDGSVQPRYYVLPWRQKLAEKLQSLSLSFPEGENSIFVTQTGMNLQYGQSNSSRRSIVLRRCEWVGDNSNPLDIKYHDEE